MSTQIDRFRDAVGANAELQEELRPVVSPVFWPAEVARIAKAHGFEVSAEDAKDFYDAVAAGNDSRALSDFELELVAGGAIQLPGISTNDPKVPV